MIRAAPAPGTLALVTGGGGFLGGAIARKLVARGARVRSFQRGAAADLAALGVEVIRGDLADRAAVERAAGGCDVVFHAAAKAGIWGRARDYWSANVVGTEHVVAACERQGVRRLVFTSSPSVVFAGRDQEGIDESVPYPGRHLAPYPRTKAIAERRVLAANGDRLATVALRPHLIWGPGDPHLVPRILARAKAGRLRLIGSHPCLVDAVYIDNAADAHLLAAERLAPRAAIGGKAYFISQGEPLPIAQLIGRILAAGGLPPVERRLPPALAYGAGVLCEALWWSLRLGGEPPMTRFLARQLGTAHWFDIGAARRDLGYDPRVSIDQGMLRLAEWLRERSEAR